VQNFWDRVGHTVAKIDASIIFDNTAKVFGIQNNREIETIVNLLIFAAQNECCIMVEKRIIINDQSINQYFIQ